MRCWHNWISFTRERFHPFTYSMMVAAFVGAHVARSDGLLARPLIAVVPLAIAILLFFFRLRLFDELKDAEFDRIHHPDRPLPRGLLKPSDLWLAARLSLVVELILWSFYGRWAWASAMLSIGYSLLMLKEFFIRTWLRRRLPLYAASHTLVIVPLSLTLFTALTTVPPLQLPPYLLSFSLGGWLFFTMFEFGRKTFASSEERAGISSYSGMFGCWGAVALAVAMAIAGTTELKANGLWTILIAATGIGYAATDTSRAAKLYRASTALLVILIYGSVAFGLKTSP